MGSTVSSISQSQPGIESAKKLAPEVPRSLQPPPQNSFAPKSVIGLTEEVVPRGLNVGDLDSMDDSEASDETYKQEPDSQKSLSCRDVVDVASSEPVSHHDSRTGVRRQGNN